MESDAFIAYIAEHPEGSRVAAHIAEVKSFGVFCELAPGVVGLLTVAEMKGLRPGQPVEEHLVVGDSIGATIAFINRQEAKIRLSQTSDS